MLVVQLTSLPEVIVCSLPCPMCGRGGVFFSSSCVTRLSSPRDLGAVWGKVWWQSQMVGKVGLTV